MITNDVLKNALRFTGRLSVLASEEEDTPVSLESMDIYTRHADVVVEEGNKYVAVFDPLDGSSNVDASIPVGTIFGIFSSNTETECLLDEDDLTGNVDPDEVRCRRRWFDGAGGAKKHTPLTPPSCSGLRTQRMERCLMSTLQPGTNLVAAGYCLYSSATQLVFTLGNGVNGFTYDPMVRPCSPFAGMQPSQNGCGPCCCRCATDPLSHPPVRVCHRRSGSSC